MGDGEERRRYPRFPGGTEFAGEGPDGRIQATSVNQGPGGAFLETKEPMRQGATLVLAVRDPLERDVPVLLVAEVMRVRLVSPPGIGILWKTAVSFQGVPRLKQFLETHFHLVLDPRKAGAFHGKVLGDVAAYDFEFGTVEPVPADTLEQWREAQPFHGLKLRSDFLPKAQYLEVKLMGAGPDSRRSKGFRKEMAMDDAAMATIDRHGPGDLTTQPITVDRMATGLTDDDMERWKVEMGKRKKASLPVTLSIQGVSVGGQLRNVSPASILLVTEGVKPALGDRALVDLPITVGTRSAAIMIVGQVARVARDKKTRLIALDLAIQSVDERGETGLFQDYLTAL
jgi:hypothetical protein